MAQVRWYLNNTVLDGWQLVDQTAATAATMNCGWVVGTGATFSSELQSNTERASTTFVGNTVPDGTLDTTLKDAFRSQFAQNGDFAAGNWTFQFAVIGVTQSGAADGQIVFRVLKADFDGANATEITTGQIATTVATDVGTTAVNITATWAAPAWTITNQYLFVQVAWKRTGAGGMTTTNIRLRTGSSATVGTTGLTADFTPRILLPHRASTALVRVPTVGDWVFPPSIASTSVPLAPWVGFVTPAPILSGLVGQHWDVTESTRTISTFVTYAALSVGQEFNAPVAFNRIDLPVVTDVGGTGDLTLEIRSGRGPTGSLVATITKTRAITIESAISLFKWHVFAWTTPLPAGDYTWLLMVTGSNLTYVIEARYLAAGYAQWERTAGVWAKVLDPWYQCYHRLYVDNVFAPTLSALPLLASAVPFATAHWPLDETSGTRADTIGGSHLTESAAISGTTGKFDGSADFVSDARYLGTPHSSAVQPDNGQSFMIRFWVKFDSAAGSGTDVANLVTKLTSYTNLTFSLFFNAGNLTWEVGQPGGYQYIQYGGAITAGQWRLIHAWYDASTGRGYLSYNAGFANPTPVLVGGFSSVDTSPFYVGAAPQFSSNVFDGQIDDLVILKNYILSPAQRTADYAAGVGVKFADWDPSGAKYVTTAPIASTASLTGPMIAGLQVIALPFIIGGAASWTVIDTATAAGVAGASLTLDATNATVLVAHAASYTSGTWVPTDADGNTWVPGLRVDDASQLFFCFAPVSNPALLVTFNGTATYAGYQAASFRGPSGTLGLTAGGGPRSGFATVTLGAISPATADLVVTGVMHESNGGGSQTIDSGFTVLDASAYAGGLNEGGALAWRVAPGGSLSPTWNVTNNVTRLVASIASVVSGSGGGEGAAVFAPAVAHPIAQPITGAFIGGVLPTFVASASKKAVSGGAVTTDAINTTGADFLALTLNYHAPSGDPGLSDNKGNTWVAAPASPEVGGAITRIYYAVNAITGTGHTFSNSASDYSSLNVEAWLIGRTTGVYDQQTSATTGSTSVQPGAITPVQDATLFLVAFGRRFDDGTLCTIDSGFTISNQTTAVPGGTLSGGLAHLLQGTAATLNPTVSFANSSDACAVTMATFKTAVLSAGGTTIYAPTVADAGTGPPPQAITAAFIGSTAQRFAPTLGGGGTWLPDAAVIDDFNRADQNPIASGWFSATDTTSYPPLQVLSNQLGITGGWGFSYYGTPMVADFRAFYTNTVWSTLADFGHQVTYTIGMFTAPPTVPGTRSGFELEFLRLQGAGQSLTLNVINAGSGTFLKSLTVSLAAGDAWGLSRDGTTLRLWTRISGVWNQIWSEVNTSHAGVLYPAMYIQDMGTGGRLDTFSGGPLTGASTQAVTGQHIASTTLVRVPTIAPGAVTITTPTPIVSGTLANYWDQSWAHTFTILQGNFPASKKGQSFRVSTAFDAVLLDLVRGGTAGTTSVAVDIYEGVPSTGTLVATSATIPTTALDAFTATWVPGRVRVPLPTVVPPGANTLYTAVVRWVVASSAVSVSIGFQDLRDDSNQFESFWSTNSSGSTWFEDPNSLLYLQVYGLTVFPPTVAEALPDTIITTNIASTAVVRVPTIQPGAVGVTTPARATTIQVFAPTIATGPVTVTLPTRGTTLQVNAPSVAPGAVTIVGATRPTTSQVFAPLLAAMALGATIPSGSGLFTPSVALNITTATRPLTSQVFLPSIAVGPASVTSGTRPTTVQMFVPSVGVGATSLTTLVIATALQLFAPAIVPGTVSITPAHRPTTVQVYAPSVTVGPASVTTATIPVGAQVFLPIISLAGITNVGASTVVSTAQVFAPTLSAGAVSVTLPHRGTTIQVFAPSLAAMTLGATIPSGSGLFAPSLALTVSTAHRASTEQVFLPVVVRPAVQAITAQTVASTVVVQVPSVSPGAVLITLPHRVTSIAINAPSIGVGAVTVTTPGRTTTVQVFAPSVAVGATGLTTAFLASTAQVFLPIVGLAGVINVGTATVPAATQVYALTVTTGAVTVTLPRIASVQSIATPSLAAVVALAHRPTTVIVRVPSVTVGAITIIAGTRPATSQCFAPALSVGGTILGGAHILSSAQLYPVLLIARLDGTFITSTTLLFPPRVQAHQAVTGATIPSTLVLRAPSVTAITLVGGATVTSTAQTYAPLIDRGLTVGFISTTAQLYGPEVAPEVGDIYVGGIAPQSRVFPPSLGKKFPAGTCLTSGLTTRCHVTSATLTSVLAVQASVTVRALPAWVVQAISVVSGGVRVRSRVVSQGVRSCCKEALTP